MAKAKTTRSKKQDAPRIAVLTSCSVSRKYSPIARIGEIEPVDTMQDLLEQWLALMNGHKGEMYSPGELYSGISFTAITEMAQNVGHDNIYIVTGGVGLVSHTSKIVPYDFTSNVNHSPNAPERVRGEKFLPHVWWELINEARHGIGTPIASTLLSQYDLIVAALPKSFIRYITGDLAACGTEALEEKVFIPVPQSMRGSFPSTIRSALVPYGPDYISGLSWNRYDKPQRVAQKFIAQSHKHGAVEHARAVQEAARQSTPATVGDVDYETMFEEHPELLKVDDPHEAIHLAKHAGLKIGGKIRFTGAWRGAKGHLEVEPSKEEADTAKANVLKVLGNSSSRLVQSDDEVLRQIGVFIAALKEASPDTLFSARDVSEWGKLTYGDDAGDITSTTKLTYVIAYNTKYLGVEVVRAGSQQMFRIAN